MLEARTKLQSAATTGNGTPIDLKGQADGIRVYITGSSGVASGAVQLEEAPTPDYAGTWSAIGSPVTVTAGQTDVIAHAVGGLLAVRARISTTVVGGTVDVELVGYSAAGA